MADDGLLVNFAIDDAPFQSKAAWKGGSWKERLTAKKSADFNRSKFARKREGPASGGNNIELGERPVKKQRTDVANNDDNSTYVPSARPSTLQPRSNGPSQRPQGSGKPLQIVSSLFSFNPTSQTINNDTQQDDEIAAQPTNAPLDPALETFTSLGLSTTLARHLLEKLEIKAPTAIQKAAITQLAKEDTDAFLQAETGSGKTLAYLLPIVQRLMALGGEDKVQRDSGLFAIVLAPTRELSKQISTVLESLLRCAHWIVSGTVIGGEKKKSEKARLRKGLNILIATPGRLADHLEHTEVLDVSNVRWLVLDEGDRLMELGFEADIEKILAKLNAGAERRAHRPTVAGLPGKRNTILCSATMKTNVQKLGEISLKDAVHIQGEGESDESGKEKVDRAFSAPAQLKQSYAVIPAKLRLVSLTAALKRAFARKGSVMKAIVFISCADSVDFHFEVFAKSSTSATSNSTETSKPPTPTTTTISTDRTHAPSPLLSAKDNPIQIFRLHGSLPQALRTSTLAAYSKCTTPAILLATDVASRGLDLPNVDLVLEYDPPFSSEEHLHRIGRTARAGAPGRAMIFLQPGPEEGYVSVLKAGRHDTGAGVVRHDSRDVLKKGFGSVGLGSGNDWEERATEWQLDMERWVIETPALLEMARRAFQSTVRAYATHVAKERGIFDMQSLHLGHLAKAFALRDKPGSMKVPGLRPSANSGKEKRTGASRAAGSKKGGDIGGAADDAGGVVDVDESRRIMRAKAKMQSAGASEFNLG